MKKNLLEKYLVHPDQIVRKLMEVIGANARGIALVVDGDGKLLTTVTDGDVRRGLLSGVVLEAPVSDLLAHKSMRAADGAIVAQPSDSDDVCLLLMEEHTIRQLPVVDDQEKVVDLVFRDDLLGKTALRLSYAEDYSREEVPAPDLPASGIIMAGGFGSRLRPLTDNVPKPMLPIGGRPLLEIIVERFEHAGIRNLYLSTHYKRKVIEEHFGDGKKHGVTIEYIHELEPIGTAGALSLIEDVSQPLVMTNGDILSKVDFRALLGFHQEHDAALTVGVRQYDIKVPFGVMQTNGSQVTSVDEKPTLDFLVNAGVYVVSPRARAVIPKNQKFDMTELIDKLLEMGESVVAFPIVEYWLDIGHLSDYETAQKFATESIINQPS